MIDSSLCHRPVRCASAGKGDAISSQPVIQQRTDVGNLAENVERALDTNKLEELVMQVTGGGQGLNGGGTLSPDAENVSRLIFSFSWCSLSCRTSPGC